MHSYEENSFDQPVTLILDDTVGTIVFHKDIMLLSLFADLQSQRHRAYAHM